MAEDYYGPVGFAKEPLEERRHWLGRILVLLLAVFIVWLAVTKVIRPPTDTPQINPQQQQLPGPE